MAILDDIKKKIRRMVKAPQTTQLTNDEIEEYINTFFLYDFPQAVDVVDLKTTQKFSTTPNVGLYTTTPGVYIFNLEDATNLDLVTDSPVYIAGRRVALSKHQEEFFNSYPPTKELGSIGTGDGATVAFTYTLPNPIVQRSVLIGTVNAANEALIAVDKPIADSYGRTGVTGQLYDQTDTSIGTINYLTGAIALTFGAAPKSGSDITYEIQTYTAGMPEAVLFFDNSFVLRPIPDKVYSVEFQIMIEPTKLLATGTTAPDVNQWWQYIAIGAAKKIFEDRGDYESVANLMPEFEKQRELVEKRTIRNNSSDITPTIFRGSPNITSGWKYNG